MKRIILGLSLVLMLAQNGFATSDEELDKLIANTTDKRTKALYRCDKTTNHIRNGDVNVCIKALKLVSKDYPHEKEIRSLLMVKIGVLYYFSEKNYVKAYEYNMKAAKLGNTQAKSNLDIICREQSWVCK